MLLGALEIEFLDRDPDLHVFEDPELLEYCRELRRRFRELPFLLSLQGSTYKRLFTCQIESASIIQVGLNAAAQIPIAELQRIWEKDAGDVLWVGFCFGKLTDAECGRRLNDMRRYLDSTIIAERG